MPSPAPLTPAQELCGLLDSAGLSRRQSATLMDVSPSLIQAWYAQAAFDNDLRTTMTTPRHPTIHMLKLARLIFETHDLGRERAMLAQLKRERRGGRGGRPTGASRVPVEDLPPAPRVRLQRKKKKKRVRERARAAGGYISRKDLQDKIASALGGKTNE